VSVTLRAVALDVAAYRAVQGSKDFSIVERIALDLADRIEADDSFASSLRADHLPLVEALRDIVAGTLKQGDSAALSYQEAAILIAESIGERVDDDELIERTSSVQTAIDAAIARIVLEAGYPESVWPPLRAVLTRGSPLRLPRVKESLPNGVGALSADEVRRAAECIASVHPKGGDASIDLALVYGGWILRAAESRRSLLLICD
jgi:hypothetical protein